MIKAIFRYFFPKANCESDDISKAEKMCSDILRIIFGLEFISNCNEELSIAIEYNWKYYYEYTPQFIDVNDEANYRQKLADIKIQLCGKNSIMRVLVPSTVGFSDIKSFVITKLGPTNIITGKNLVSTSITTDKNLISTLRQRHLKVKSRR